MAPPGDTGPVSDARAEPSGHRSSHRGRHVSVDEKQKAVLRVLKGENPGAVAADLDLSESRVSRWIRTFLDGGTAALVESHRRAHGHSGGYWSKVWLGLGILLAVVVATLLLARFA